MKDQYRRLEAALEAAGFTPREGRHRVWRHPTGVVAVTARTPSDHRTFLNDRADARRAMKRAGVVVTI